MTFTGHFHPLLVHFPIGLVLLAAAAELAAMVTGRTDWHAVAVANVRVGAAFASLTVLSGWVLAVSTSVDDPSSLAWHRGLGTLAAIAALGAALASGNGKRRWPSGPWMYRAALFGAAALVGVAGHLGGLLVWGADFLRP